MNAEDSYFLLLDDPAHFQLDYQALANWDGTPPGDSDYTAAGKTVCWADCPALGRIADLGTYQTTVLGTTVTGEQRGTGQRICIWAAGPFMKMQKQKKPPAPAKGPNGCGRT